MTKSIRLGALTLTAYAHHFPEDVLVDVVGDTSSQTVMSKDNWSSLVRVAEEVVAAKEWRNHPATRAKWLVEGEPEYVLAKAVDALSAANGGK